MRNFFIRKLPWVCVGIVVLSACGGGGGGSSKTPVVVPSPTLAPSPTPTSTGVDAAAFECPTSDSPAVHLAGNAGTEASRRIVPRRAHDAAAVASTTRLLAVTYSAGTLTANRPAVAAREAALGATLTRELAFERTGLVTHILSVPAANAARIEASLRTQAGVRNVGLTGGRRHVDSVNAPYYTSDPYFQGFTTTNAPDSNSTPPPPTFETQPLVESGDVPGQWDMHVPRFDYAFAYSQPNNGSTVYNPAATGSNTVKLAVIDTGEDTTHPELKAKIRYQHCFITSPANNVQSSSAFTTDEDGHGTDVAGLAAEQTNKGYGFSAAGGGVVLWAYRVFPTPDDNCTNDSTTDNQCTTNTADIASAILDAVNQGVNVISMSLGGSTCVNGQDSDSVEGNAVAEAIAHNIIVVAAAGNAGTEGVESPACDPGVIAVGASALADGTTNGSGITTGSPTAPAEYVASYTDHGSPGAIVNSSTAWGIVAPGGDPSGASDTDDLHWIENIWTSTPYMQNATDNSFTGNCESDYPADSANGPADCRILIAGTSMATPHVAGAAALILSVNSSYQNPTTMKALLCSTAQDIGDPSEGCGRLDVYRAMAAALNDPAPPGPSPLP